MLNRQSISAKDFVNAAETGDLDLVNQYIALHPNDRAAIDVCVGYWTALRCAASAGHLDIVNALIKANASVNLADPYCGTALYSACEKGHVNIVHALLNVPGININARTREGNYPLKIAALRVHDEIVKILLAAGAEMYDYDHLIEDLKICERKEIIDMLELHLHRKDLQQKLLASIHEEGDQLDNETIEFIQRLSDRNFKRLSNIVNYLKLQGNLTPESLKLALDRVTVKIPAVPESKVTKGDKRGTKRREHKLNSGITFFVKPNASKNEDNFGGQAKINKGYATADAFMPEYTVKRLCQGEERYPTPREVVAARETKYAQHLKRQAAWYISKNGPVVVMAWQPGEDLRDMTEWADLATFSRLQKIRWILSIAIDLEQLHKDGRLHADLKLEQCIRSLDSMKLIDFGCAQKVDSTKGFCCSRGYIDVLEGQPRKLASDMFALGYIVAPLHPELIHDELHIEVNEYGDRIFNHVSEKRKDVKFTYTDQAILSLYEALMEPRQEDRCTNQQVILFCQMLLEMLSVKDELDENDLNKLLSATINRNEFVIEDALRGSMRPAKFGATPKKREAVNAPVTTLYAETKRAKMS